MSRFSSNFIHPSFHHQSWAWLGPWKWHVFKPLPLQMVLCRVNKMSKKPVFFLCFGLHPRKLSWEWQKKHQNPPAEDVSSGFLKGWFSIVIFVFFGAFDGQKKQPKKRPKPPKVPSRLPPNSSAGRPLGPILPAQVTHCQLTSFKEVLGRQFWWHFWHKSSENVDEFSTHHQQTWKSSPCNNWTRCFVEYALQII